MRVGEGELPTPTFSVTGFYTETYPRAENISPKAGVKDEKGNLWIAKFPAAADPGDTGAWEMVANELAKDAGLDVATGQAKRFNDKRHTYLSKRFDRIGTKRYDHPPGSCIFSRISIYYTNLAAAHGLS